jgi:hypothetical protein
LLIYIINKCCFSGVWLINPAQPEVQYPATPVLIPLTYMPIVSTYPPAETQGPPVSTLLPIYPKIGQNVKSTTAGRSGQKPTAKVTEPVTIPAVQTTFGEYEGGVETTTEEWATSKTEGKHQLVN